MPKLGDVVGRDPVAVEDHEALSRAAASMYENRVGSVVVLNDAGGLIGIFTERDLLRACAAGVDTQSSRVANWMTKDPVTASDDDEVAAALQVMIDNEFRHLPVVGGGGLVGVVSMRELSRALQHERMG